MKQIALLTLLFACLTATAWSAPKPQIPGIRDIKKIKPNATVFKTASRQTPLVIRSELEASKHFGTDALTELKKQVDFDQQFVLVFAWRGSGQDRLSYDVAESFPEQVRFRYQPGRTKDLRPHVYTFALRSNVKWTPPK